MVSREFKRECRKACLRYSGGAPFQHLQPWLAPKGIGRLRRWALKNRLVATEQQG